jgi:hypothetical protein
MQWQKSKFSVSIYIIARINNIMQCIYDVCLLDEKHARTCIIELLNSVDYIYFMIIYMSKSITFLFFYILADLCNANNGSDFKWAKDPDEKSHLWKARHDILLNSNVKQHLSFCKSMKT